MAYLRGSLKGGEAPQQAHGAIANFREINIQQNNTQIIRIGLKWVATARNGLKLGQNGSECFQDTSSTGFGCFFGQKQFENTKTDPKY